MNKLLLALTLAITGCVPEYVPTTPDIIVFGDSLCESTHNSYGGSPWPIIAGIAMNCEGGRKSVDYPDNLPNARIILYSMGSNDAGSTSNEDYKADLIAKFDSTTAEIHCILPDPEHEIMAGIRGVMFEVCSNTIEPREHGYLFSALDGIHGTASDHLDFGNWIKETFVND